MKTIYLIFILILLLIAQSCSSKSEDVSYKENVSSKQEAVLSVEAALVFKSGDVKPVARTEFFLLDKNFETVLQESGYMTLITTSTLPQSVKDSFSKMDKINSVRTFAAVIDNSQSLDVLQLPLAKAITATQSHITYRATTDFQGKAQFKEVKAGTYYLFGYAKVGESVAVWNVKMEIKEGQNSIILDQNNAETS